MTLLTGKGGALPLSHPLNSASTDAIARAEVEKKSMTERDGLQAKSQNTGGGRGEGNILMGGRLWA